MPINLNKLSALAVTKTNKPGYYGDGGVCGCRLPNLVQKVGFSDSKWLADNAKWV